MSGGSIFWGDKKHIKQLHQPTQQQTETKRQRSKVNKKTKNLALPPPRSSSSSNTNQHQAVRVPETNLTGVLHALVSHIRQELVAPPQRPLFVPPKHLGYATNKPNDTTSQFYPLSILKEDQSTNHYFRQQEDAETEKADRDGRKKVLKKVQTSTAENQRYPFDRSAGDYIRNALQEDEEKEKAEQRKVEALSESKEQITALRAEGEWIKQQKQGMEHRIKRLEHLLSLLQHEQKKEISREMTIIEGAKKSANQMEQQLEEQQNTGPKNAGLDTGSINEHRQMVASIQADRADTADRIMRILQDYDLISGAQMATYLVKSLQNVVNAPHRAQATFEASLSGITNPDNIPSSSRNTSTSGSMNSELGGTSSTNSSTSNALAFMTLRKKSGQDVPAAGLGSDLMRTPRGRYAPIVTNASGVVSHMGFGKRKKKNNSSNSSSRSSTALSSTTTVQSSGRLTTAEESALLSHTNRVNMPDGPMSRRGRALMYRNYRSLLVQENIDASGSGSGGGGGGEGPEGMDTVGTFGSIATSTTGTAPTTAASSSRPPRGLRDLAPNWYPHMGTMPAPVGIAERALRDPTDPNAGKRDGRGLPPEEVLPDDDQPYEGRVRWFAKKNDLNFYPMLTAPSFSRSFAADKIIRKMMEEGKTPTTMKGLPSYRLSMSMAGAGTYGESSNAFSFLVGRPLQPLQ